MGRKTSRRKPPAAPVPPAGWRLLPPPAPDPATPAIDDEGLAEVMAALERVRAQFAKLHGREPTEEETIELISLALVNGFDEETLDVMLADLEAAGLGPGPDGEDDGAKGSPPRE